MEVVRSIIAEVVDRGDDALRDLTSRLDGVESPSIQVDPEEITGALGRIDPEIRTALEFSAANVRHHHQDQVRPERRTEHKGLVVRSASRPVERAGCYAPGDGPRTPRLS